MKKVSSSTAKPRSVSTNDVLLKGRPVSRGMAVGTVVCLHGGQRQFFKKDVDEARVGTEILRYRRAVSKAKQKIKALAKENSEYGGNSASIFDLHLNILEDSSISERIEQGILSEKVNAEWAVKLFFDEYISKYRAIPDEHFRDRYLDVEDISEHIQTALGGEKDPVKLQENAVIVAKEIRPSTLAELARHNPSAIVTENGGWTSHSFILARELEIPAVTGIRKLMRRVRTGDQLIVDGFDGTITLSPTESTLDAFTANAKNSSDRDTQVSEGPTKTLDGHEIKIRANFDIAESFKQARSLGAQGIGLFRSEYLFNRNKGFPSEIEQIKAYREIADYAGEERARIRTFDLGVDQVHGQSSRREKNPALGLRGVRLGLNSPRHFRTQIRALLQASTSGNVDIILPMISGVDEVRRVKELVREEEAQLLAKGIGIGKPRLGVMIEVPSAVFAIDSILNEVDSVLLGTNDLVQYILAVDRDNEAVSPWFRTLHPSIFSALKIVIRAAVKAGKPIVVCGEMAGSPFYAPILLGLGARELSMNTNSIARVRRIVASIALEEASELITAIETLVTPTEIEETVERFITERWSHLFPSEFLLNRRS